MVSESQWAAERQRFVDSNVPGGHGTSLPATDPSHRDAAGGDQDSLLGMQFAQVAEYLFDADSVQNVLERIVIAAVQIVPGARLASITLRDEHGRFSTPVQTHPLATALDELQYTHDEGPCVAATRASSTGLVGSPGLARDPQWPSWGPAAAERGMHSVLSVGLFPHHEPPRVGAVNCYSPYPDGLDAEPEVANVALLLGAHAATALTTQQRLESTDYENHQLRGALERRDVIGQAKGILMHRRRISAGEAFDILRKASQDLHIKLADIAATLATNPEQLLNEAPTTRAPQQDAH